MKKFFISIKDSFINVFKKDSKEENLFKLDGRVPLKKAIPLLLKINMVKLLPKLNVMEI